MKERPKIKCKHCPTIFTPKTWNSILCKSEKCREKNKEEYTKNKAAKIERDRKSFEKRLEKSDKNGVESYIRSSLNFIMADIKETGGDNVEGLIRGLVGSVRYSDNRRTEQIIYRMMMEMQQTNRETLKSYSKLMPVKLENKK